MKIRKISRRRSRFSDYTEVILRSCFTEDSKEMYKDL